MEGTAGGSSRSTTARGDRRRTAAHDFGCRNDGLTCSKLGSLISYDEGDSRTALAAPLNPYQASSLERSQRAALGVSLYAPLLQHHVGNREGIGLPKFFKVPECQPNQ
jgi:hypothetical protein